jgi:hypothetical protein
LYRKCGKGTECISESDTGQFVKGTVTTDKFKLDAIVAPTGGPAWGEPALIKLAYAFEQATKVGKAPRILPGVEVNR